MSAAVTARAITRLPLLGVAALLVLVSACSGGDSSSKEPEGAANASMAATATVEQVANETGCMLSRRFTLADADGPAKDATITLVDGGAMTHPDQRGRWSLDVGSHSSVVVRVESASGLRDNVRQGGHRGSANIPSGIAEVTYKLDSDCNAQVANVRNVTPGESHARPQPPVLPDRFNPSAATLNARVPAANGGTAANVPWTGSFWLTAPVVTAGICDIKDTGTRDAAEAALRILQQTQNLGWQLKRDDSVCDPDRPGPKMMIMRQDLDDDSLVGREWEDGVDTPGCDPDGDPTNCWIDVAYVTANPAGFDQQTRDEKVATMLHEIGHGLGLAHATICGNSVMWPDDECATASRPTLGADDVASLNDLLSATLGALRRAR